MVQLSCSVGGQALNFGRRVLSASPINADELSRNALGKPHRTASSVENNVRS
ncbi:hypothetical protein ANMWB30_42690 [Arthrobacter sp. MWB30]|nr:hypothetical protein ANMWB30_42690 [Arthrobacter sp. MWB30]